MGSQFDPFPPWALRAGRDSLCARAPASPLRISARCAANMDSNAMEFLPEGSAYAQPVMGSQFDPNAPVFRFRTEAVDVPNDVVARLQHQFEFYFSVLNLSQDTYLNSIMDADNFVEIRSIAAFRRVQTITSDFSLILGVMGSLPMLEVDLARQLVRPRVMPISKELRIKADTAPQCNNELELIQELFGEGPKPLDSSPHKVFARELLLMFNFATEEEAAMALVHVRGKAASEGRRICALLRDPSAPFQQPPRQQHQQQFYPQFNGDSAYGYPQYYPPQFDQYGGAYQYMPNFGMVPGRYPMPAGQGFRGGMSGRGGRDNRPRSTVAPTVQRREDGTPAVNGQPRPLTEGAIPVQDVARTAHPFQPRRGGGRGGFDHRRRLDGGPDSFVPAPVPEPAPVLEAEYFPPLSVNRPDAKAPVNLSVAMADVVKGVKGLDVKQAQAAPKAEINGEGAKASVTSEPLSPKRPEPRDENSGAERPSFAEMAKRKQQQQTQQLQQHNAANAS
eukprot:m.229155 g.229155  ORF g.229155 m.229155 type:complete len:505 (-) comp11865_c0_seq1:265-1779(-)